MTDAENGISGEKMTSTGKDSAGEKMASTDKDSAEGKKIWAISGKLKAKDVRKVMEENKSELKMKLELAKSRLRENVNGLYNAVKLLSVPKISRIASRDELLRRIKGKFS